MLQYMQLFDAESYSNPSLHQCCVSRLSSTCGCMQKSKQQACVVLQTSGARVEQAVGGLSNQMQESTSQILGAMGGLSSQIAQSHGQLSNQLSQSHQHLSNELNVVKMLAEAMAHGIGELQVSVKQQTKVMVHVMGYCENIQAGQSAIIDNQVQIMNAIVSTREEVTSGVEKILKTMQTQRMEATLEVLKVVTRQMVDHLKDPGKQCCFTLRHNKYMYL